MKRVKLKDGRVIEVDDIKADRLVRKGRGTYDIAVRSREVAMRRAEAR